MRRAIPLGAITALLVGCTSDKPVPTAVEFRVPLYAINHAGGNGDINMGTHMTGDEEVFVAAPGAPTPADSKAQGEAIFRVNTSENGTVSVDFRLIASNIDNVIMSHIHCGPRGANGPIRMWLYPVIGPPSSTTVAGPSGAGPQNGVLASGTFYPTGVICPATAVIPSMPLLDAMQAGLTYVNVHTNDGTDGVNTGPGDFPGGEIRGQLDHGR